MDEFSMLYEGTDKGIVEFELVRRPFEFPDVMLHIAVMLKRYRHGSIAVQLRWLD